MHRMTQDQLNEQLLNAVADNDIKAARRAIEERADVNAIDEDGWTPLHIVVRWGHTEIAKTLIENGAFINAKNKDGDTSLHIATKWRNTETAALLKQQGGV